MAVGDVPSRIGPLVLAGSVLGMGLGGFVDGIVFHQLLQWHNLLSHRLPPDTLVNAKINMFWDGVFHVATWIATAAGVGLLWRAAGRADVPHSGRSLLGGMLMGWGLFNLLEGIIDHHLLQLHHVRELEGAPGVWDWAFLASGAAFALIGVVLVRSARRLGCGDDAGR